jgi:methionyl-tRNA formyltransferase
MRVIFLGTPEFAVPSLQALVRSSFEVCAVFTQPDRPAGRGQKAHAPAVKVCALEAGIPVHQPEKIRDVENQALLASFEADFIAVVAYGQILPKWLLEMPRLGCVNVHGSLLPAYRGAAPVAWAILNGDAVTGITTMLMDERLDTGPMLLKREFEITSEMTSGELAGELSAIGADLLLPTLSGLADGSVKPEAQDDRLATFAPRITKEMAPIDWRREAWPIHNQVRGLNPWPLAYTEWLGQRVQIMQTAPPNGHEEPTAEPGVFLGTSEHGMYVACAGGRLEVLAVQPAGKKRIPGRDYANGARLKPGQRLTT